MAKVHINDEVFDYDTESKPLAEMIALEKALNVTYGQWEQDMRAGSARALAGMIWLVWRRDGRDVPFADIESGAVPVNYDQFLVEEDGGVEGEGEDPTTAGGTKEALSSTAGATSRRSAKSG